jgi:L-lactate dehydrogenase
MDTTGSKIAIIGAGRVGSTFAYALTISGIVQEIVLIDRNAEKAAGESMDLNHGTSFIPPVKIYSSGYEGCNGSDIVVITSGVAPRPGETPMDLADRNVEAFKEMIPRIVEHAGDAILLVVSNPMDVLTYAALRISGLPASRVMGSGTVLDSSRLRFLLGRHCGVDARHIHAYIIGEQGDSELPVWSSANIGSMSLVEYCLSCKRGCDRDTQLAAIFGQVQQADFEIIRAKGATNYAIALALVRIVRAIVRDESSILPVSTLIRDYYGIKDVCLGIPSIVSRSGATTFLKLKLSSIEKEQLKHSADTLRSIINRLRL